MTTSTTPIAIPGYRAGTWTIDRAHSEVGFSVRHMMISKVRGKFTDFSGEIVTGDDPADSTVTAVIHMASIDTSNAQRDEHLRSADFFETAAHPVMTYRSTGLRRTTDEFVVDGELTLRDVTRAVPLRLEITGIGPDYEGVTRAGFSATAEISRGDFGITFTTPLAGGGVAVGDKVTLELEIQAVLQG